MEKKIPKMRIGKRYWLDGVEDVSGLFIGTDNRGNYKFVALVNNDFYLPDLDGTYPMPKGEYKRAPELVEIY